MIKLEEVTPVHQFLGCRHEVLSTANPVGKPVKAHIYDMQKIMNQCVEAYASLAGPGAECGLAETPILEEDAQPKSGESSC